MRVAAVLEKCIALPERRLRRSAGLRPAHIIQRRSPVAGFAWAPLGFVAPQAGCKPALQASRRAMCPIRLSGFNDITRRLIYPKGAYVLHMIRMMMWDRKTGDDDFKAMMQDFVKTYTNKAATTENFKAMVEKHMTGAMDVDGNRSMDWFFNEYVYGTFLPSYKIDYTFDKDPSGDVVFGFKITQSGVDDQVRGRTFPVPSSWQTAASSFWGTRGWPETLPSIRKFLLRE